MRKHSLNQKRLVMKSKMSGSCTSLLQGDQLNDRIRPAWMMRRDTIHSFDDPLLAIDFMMSALQLQPK